MRYRVAALFLLLLAAPALAAKKAPPPPVEINVHWKSGTVTYQTSPTGQSEQVTGVHVVARDAYVTTGPASSGLLVYPETSRIAIGQNTTVQVGQFEAKGQAFFTSLRLPATGGAVRFDVHHKEDGESSYVFQTQLATVTVRGTSALLSDGISGDTLMCLVCEAGDVVARLRGRDYALLSGETMRIAPSGHVTIEKTSEAVVQTFALTGLSTEMPPPEPKPTPRRIHIKIKL